MDEQDRDRYHSQIFSAIAHEIRNPLQGIMASAAALSCHVGEETKLEPFLETIKREASRINQLIDDMLELTHSVNFDQRPHFIKTILEDAIRNTQEAAQDRKASIVLSTNDDKSRIRADGHGLSRAFTAILMNAVESKEEGGNIQIQIQIQDKDAFVSIRDNGRGISTDDMKFIFEPFFSTQRKKAGLGLSIAEYVVRAHNGQIQVKSELEKGTAVTVQLPILK